jgi:hypothetical protein
MRAAARALTVISHGWAGAKVGFTTRVVPHPTAMVGPPDQGTTATPGPSTLTIVMVPVLLPQLAPEMTRIAVETEIASTRGVDAKGTCSILRILTPAVVRDNLLAHARMAARNFFSCP